MNVGGPMSGPMPMIPSSTCPREFPTVGYEAGPATRGNGAIVIIL
jgi:hypothetical protein